MLSTDAKPTISDRYASAVNSSCLTVDPRTTLSDTDVLGAMGLADATLTQQDHALAVPLERLFAGDHKASHAIVEILADMAWRQARATKVKLARVESVDMARACLAWHRDGVCKPCGGHGKAKIPGAPILSERDCLPCAGIGRIPFDRQFPVLRRPLARWLVAEMEREQSRAGPAAMKKLAVSMNF